MKYVIYALIVLFIPIRKTIGVFWIFIAWPFRKYARNVVYNYALQNGVYLKRLLERPIVEYSYTYVINKYHGTDGGYIQKRKISKLEYYVVLWLLWGWVDDDSNDDTFDYGHVERLRLENKIYRWLFRWRYRDQYGNSFDLGDHRQPNFNFWASWLWTWRNTAYNFKYMLHEENRPDRLFNVTIFGKEFGYVKEGELKGRLIFWGNK